MPLAEGDNIVGRGDECAIVVDADTVSRRHACITVTGGKVRVRDLDSTNGTFVNKLPVVAATMLKNGDEVSFGSATMRYRIIDRSAMTVRRVRT
jgi:pSer/pThr/pTyr-binding forkhead associated (FHA) protein